MLDASRARWPRANTATSPRGMAVASVGERCLRVARAETDQEAVSPALWDLAASSVALWLVPELTPEEEVRTDLQLVAHQLARGTAPS